MSGKKSKAKLIQFRRDKSKYMDIVLAALNGDGDDLILTKHCKQEAINDDIPIKVLLDVLRFGKVVEGPYQHGTTWRCRHEGFSSGFNIAVVSSIEDLDGREVVLITTFLLT